MASLIQENDQVETTTTNTNNKNNNNNNNNITDDYGISIFTLDENAINNLAKDSINFNISNQQTQINRKIRGRASYLKTRLRGQDIENGGHFKELYSDGKFNQYINKT